MTKSGLTKFLLITFIHSQILLFISAKQEEFRKTFKIWNNGEIIGILKEKRRNYKNFIQYEKHLHYFLREDIFSRFTFSHDFSNITGKIFKNNKIWIIITNNNIKIKDNKKIKSYELSDRTLPSSIMYLYIHEILKKKNELPERINVLYENTGDILEIKIKRINSAKYIEIEYFFDKINLRMVEFFLPEKNAYFIKCGPIYFIDEKLENDFIPLIINDLVKQNNKVTAYENFNGFFDAKSVQYKLKFTSDISIPEDNRQIIIEKHGNGDEKTFLLKVTEENVIRKEEYTKEYNDYLLPFDTSDNIKKLSYKITKGVIEQDKKIQKIMEWLKENINPSNDGPFDPEIVMKNKRGDCQGISNLFLAMCSSLKIPARAVAGIIIFEQNGEYFYTFHQWVELRKETRWISCDPTFDIMKIGLNYIKLTNLEKKLNLLKLINALNLKIEIIKEDQ